MHIYIQIIIGWKYSIACIVCEDKSFALDFVNNDCLNKYR